MILSHLSFILTCSKGSCAPRIFYPVSRVR